MKNIFLTSVIIVLQFACRSDSHSGRDSLAEGVHKALVEEVLQTSKYTYLSVKEGNANLWLAVPKMQAAAGETYYYKEGIPISNFESKELNRKFSEVFFIDMINARPVFTEKVDISSTHQHSGDVADTHHQHSATSESNVVHTVIADEILQTSKYTYIHTKEGDTEIWIAVTKMDASIGKTYYFTGGLQMTNFVSKELNKTFDEVLFVDNIYSNIPSNENIEQNNSQNIGFSSKGSAIDLEKKKVEMKHADSEVTIAKLLKDKKLYSGKIIKIKGQVTKFTPGIMNRNWIHLQDGTDFCGKFDLTVTTDQEVKKDEMITVEGKISLDKDFGFGYFYEVIMEDAKRVK